MLLLEDERTRRGRIFREFVHEVREAMAQKRVEFLTSPPESSEVPYFDYEGRGGRPVSHYARAFELQMKEAQAAAQACSVMIEITKLRKTFPADVCRHGRYGLIGFDLGKKTEATWEEINRW